MKGEQQQRLFKEIKTFPPAMFRWMAIPTAQVTIRNLKLCTNKKIEISSYSPENIFIQL